jgi:hypothetical protein
MGTFIFAWLLGILGLIMIAGGIWGFIHLWNQRTHIRIPLRYEAMTAPYSARGPRPDSTPGRARLSFE